MEEKFHLVTSPRHADKAFALLCSAVKFDQGLFQLSAFVGAYARNFWSFQSIFFPPSYLYGDHLPDDCDVDVYAFMGSRTTCYF